MKLAEQLSREHHVPAVAVFWVESEDHDWNEIASVSVLDADLQRHTITLPPPPGAGHAPVCTIALAGTIAAAIDELAAALPATEFTSTVIETLRLTYAPGATVSDAFARLLDHLLGDHGLVVFECSDRAAKPLAREIFARELANPGRTWALANEAGHQLAAKGYHVQVEGSRDDGVAVFRLDGSRAPIAHNDAAALTRDAEAHPEGFSPNVLLRPIVEDAIFPTVAYVSGPSELAYLAQLRPVYAHFGVPMPLMYPRGSATILDSAGARFLEKHDLPIEALRTRRAALNRLLAAALPEHVERAPKVREHNERKHWRRLWRRCRRSTRRRGRSEVDAGQAATRALTSLRRQGDQRRGKSVTRTLRRQFVRAQAQGLRTGCRRSARSGRWPCSTVMARRSSNDSCTSCRSISVTTGC